jgi:hypothetical protein
LPTHGFTEKIHSGVGGKVSNLEKLLATVYRLAREGPKRYQSDKSVDGDTEIEYENNRDVGKSKSVQIL